MKKACDEALAEVYLYLDRELTWWRRRSIRRHLRECPPCLNGYSFEERLRVVVRQCMSVEVPQDFILRLNEAIRREQTLPSE
ncbi:MAG TPA: mycothiol system anti-sigma-R factor [Acidimicrobiia bacterium]|jgi:mycothiol system anti-sigma-R factor|nr:mycothiol system anti-sigma-R factor [Acidimicrobiia bacterium]